MKTPFVWLGSGRTRKWPLDDKAILLDRAAKAGLPVPPGVILLDEFVKWMVSEGVVLMENRDNGRPKYTAPSPLWLAETLFDGAHLPRLTDPVIIRDLFSDPISTYNSDGDPPAQWLHRDVYFSDPPQLAHWLCAGWSAASASVQRRDLLINEMIPCQTSGLAFIRPNHTLDEVIIHANTAVSPPPPLLLPQLRTWQRPDPEFPPAIQRLQMLLRGLRRTFGKGNWQLEWGDDGRICWLLFAQTILPGKS